MSTLRFRWANLPCPMEGFEVADGDDGLAYVYGQNDAAKKIATRLVDMLRGEAELTALRQQVADLRAALEEQDEACRARVFAVTQPQEVQP